MSTAELPVTGNTTHTRPENRAFFPALDGVRGVAFLMVFFHHYMGLPFGWAGVDVFFVLSGFLITGILVDTRDKPNRARIFYMRRSLRIFPLYYAVLLFLLALTPIFRWRWDWHWIIWPLYVGNWVLTFHRGGSLDASTTALMYGWLHGANANVLVYIGHFWSLCVEEQFYFFWPWVVFYTRSRKVLLWISASIVALWPLLRFLVNQSLPAYKVSAELVEHSTIFRLDTLMLGAFIALIYRSDAREALFRWTNHLVWIAGLAAAAAYVAFLRYPAMLHSNDFSSYVSTIGFTILAVLSGIVIVGCLVPGSLLYRFFTNRVLRWMGRISYGAYVLHDIPHLLYYRIAGRMRFPAPLSRHMAHFPSPILALICTFALGWLSFRFLETPFLNLKERYTVKA